ncbi:MAG: hypothetical protein HFH60_09530 [Lachnospiraceae bacterium]|nr:hypothetical protein [Lachnospiraceae bacterium]MCI9546911.1 hypothetical protein [Lachnospiraceae bacterium]
MNKNRRQAPFVNMGSSFLLVVFLLLCLVTLATLSFSSAQSDKNFSQRIADRKTEYYGATNQAEELLGQIDGILAAIASSDKPSENLKKLDFDQIDSIDADIQYNPQEATISYQVPINEKQALDVLLTVNDLEKAPKTGYYQIEKWQTINTQKWETDDTLQLMPIP